MKKNALGLARINDGMVEEGEDLLGGGYTRTPQSTVYGSSDGR
jgi:hypothetical protein